MRAAMTQLNLSPRAYHRILKLARTIADLAGSEEIQSASFRGGAAVQAEVDDELKRETCGQSSAGSQTHAEPSTKLPLPSMG